MSLPTTLPVRWVLLDVDNVLYDGNLGLDVARRLARGFKALRAVASLGAAVVRYKAGGGSIDDVMAVTCRLFAGEPADTLHAQTRSAVREHCLGALLAETCDLITAYRSRDIPVVLFSTAPREAVAVIADVTGATHAEGTAVHVESGRLTDRPITPIPYGDGKVAIARRIADELGVDLGEAAYLGDGSSDVPMLEAVGHPVCVNSSRALRGIAAERGWPVHETRTRRR